MKIFGWGTNPDYGIVVKAYKRGETTRHTFEIRKHGETKLLSPIKGWSTWEEALAAAHDVLGEIGADHLKMQEAENGC